LSLQAVVAEAKVVALVLAVQVEVELVVLELDLFRLLDPLYIILLSVQEVTAANRAVLVDLRHSHQLLQRAEAEVVVIVRIVLNGMVLAADQVAVPAAAAADLVAAAQQAKETQVVTHQVALAPVAMAAQVAEEPIHQVQILLRSMVALAVTEHHTQLLDHWSLMPAAVVVGDTAAAMVYLVQEALAVVVMEDPILVALGQEAQIKEEAEVDQPGRKPAVTAVQVS
jgi:hypothetical protein